MWVSAIAAASFASFGVLIFASTNLSRSGAEVLMPYASAASMPGLTRMGLSALS
ncbi:hypothetical protein D3C74_489340 [compost metagenome]